MKLIFLNGVLSIEHDLKLIMILIVNYYNRLNVIVRPVNKHLVTR